MRTVKYWRLVRSLHDFLSNIGDLSICLHDIVSNMIARPHISGFASHHPHHHQILYLNSIIIQNNSLGVVKWSIILKPLTEIKKKQQKFQNFWSQFYNTFGLRPRIFPHLFVCKWGRYMLAFVTASTILKAFVILVWLIYNERLQDVKFFHFIFLKSLKLAK